MIDPGRLSCAHSAFPRLSLPVSLALIRDLGFSAVDVCVFEGYEHIPAADLVADPERAADAVRSELDRHQLTPVDVFGIFGSSFAELAPNHPDPSVREESRERFERLLGFGAALGAPGLTILPGAEFGDPAADLERAGAELAWRAERAGATGLRLSFEPHYGSIAPTPERALALLELVPAVTLALDYSHFVFQGIPESEIERLLQHAGHVHVRQAAPGQMQTRTVEGEIDLARMCRQLEATGYSGHYGLEYQWDPDWLDFTHVDCISETAETRAALLAVTAHTTDGTPSSASEVK